MKALFLMNLVGPEAMVIYALIFLFFAGSNGWFNKLFKRKNDN